MEHSTTVAVDRDVLAALLSTIARQRSRIIELDVACCRLTDTLYPKVKADMRKQEALANLPPLPPDEWD